MSTICDICSKPNNFSDSYALTTTQVTTSRQYWDFMIQQHNLDRKELMLLVPQQAAQQSGWLVCEECSKMFNFDKDEARSYAALKQDPPGSGVVAIDLATAAAEKAWVKKDYGYLNFQSAAADTVEEALEKAKKEISNQFTDYEIIEEVVSREPQKGILEIPAYSEKKAREMAYEYESNVHYGDEQTKTIEAYKGGFEIHRIDITGKCNGKGLLGMVKKPNVISRRMKFKSQERSYFA